MAEGLNKVMLIGHLGADPELKYTQGNQAIMRLRLATTESYQTKNGERQQRTAWHSVVCWGRRGEALSKILVKGRAIYVEGRLDYQQWEDKEGVKRSKTEIVATDILLLGSGNSSGGGGGSRGGGGSSGRTSGGGYGGGDDFGGGGGDFPADDFGDDDIPF
jgi:single-strand DNA-binding protein